MKSISVDSLTNPITLDRMQISLDTKYLKFMRKHTLVEIDPDNKTVEQVKWEILQAMNEHGRKLIITASPKTDEGAKVLEYAQNEISYEDFSK